MRFKAVKVGLQGQVLLVIRANPLNANKILLNANHTSFHNKRQRDVDMNNMTLLPMSYMYGLIFFITCHHLPDSFS